MLPDFFWQATNEGDHPVGGIAPPPWSRESALSFLDDAGIDVAITSISTPGDDAAARLLARRCNELAAAELIRHRFDRFGGFACLPLPDVDGALAELAYALDDLQLDGVLLFSNVRGVYLGDSQFTPLFDELQRRAAVVFVHPNPSPDPSAHALGLPDTLIDLIDFTADTTRFGIIDEMRLIPGAEGRATAAETFRRLYWDTAASWGDPCCACCATSWESTPSYSASTTPECAAIWPSPAATTSRPPRNSPTASGRPSSAPPPRR
jgi:hypothetical protein